MQSILRDSSKGRAEIEGSREIASSLSALSRFWEITRSERCPLVGICLSLSDQLMIMKQSGIDIKGKKPIDIHEALVGHSEGESKLSRRIDLHLNRKFGKEMRECLWDGRNGIYGPLAGLL